MNGLYFHSAICLHEYAEGNFTFYRMYLILVYADAVTMLGERIYTVKKNTETLLVTSKEIGLEVNDRKSKYYCYQKVRGICR
jgi:hypothetical protein